ncbi:hypothetical protein [Couchioplanes azureus]|uniref:hypothetical protein n=1 Tax=Couchioplanes caeruleus TaxID=56438 RepID=UPI00166FC908|nr:hypothetical protein [Couchioplanes caeruleus]GGQ79563.1 hypothetical protein GCM10010166_57010 [Couchioplanes caeruleus subsp. azureus]
MQRLLGMVGALVGVGLAAGCIADDHEAPRPPEEMARDRARAIVRETAADAFQEQFGTLPPPKREFESRCDSARWHDVDRAYVMQGSWELPLAAVDQERTMLALHRSGRFDIFTPLGHGRFSVGGDELEKSVVYSATSGEPPTTVRLSVSTPCLLDSK